MDQLEKVVRYRQRDSKRPMQAEKGGWSLVDFLRSKAQEDFWESRGQSILKDRYLHIRVTNLGYFSHQQTVESYDSITRICYPPFGRSCLSFHLSPLYADCNYKCIRRRARLTVDVDGWFIHMSCVSVFRTTTMLNEIFFFTFLTIMWIFRLFIWITLCFTITNTLQRSCCVSGPISGPLQLCLLIATSSKTKICAPIWSELSIHTTLQQHQHLHFLVHWALPTSLCHSYCQS